MRKILSEPESRTSVSAGRLKQSRTVAVTRDASVNADSAHDDANRADARRLQVLDAASTCFRQHGFHATSIARISEAAQMSPGHIYHYFRNKEAIMAGIVEQNLTEFVEFAQQLEMASERGKFIEALLAQISGGVDKQTKASRLSLNIEILAEAARNPEIAALLRQSGDIHFSRSRELFRRAPSMRRLSAGELDARITVINSLFDGLMVRVLCQPAMDKRRVTQVIRRVLRFLLDEDLA